MANVITILNDPHPLLDAFRACDYSVLQTTKIPAEADLTDCILYLTDIFASIKRPWLLLKVKRKLRKANIPVVTWNRDAPWHLGMRTWRRILAKQLSLVDIYAAHSLQQAEYFSDAPVYMPNAAAIDRYHLYGQTLVSLRNQVSYRHDVSFVGSLNPDYDRIEYRRRFLQQLAVRLEALGISSCFRHGLHMNARDQARLIQESRINLNFGAACDMSETSWGLPERCFGIPACGGFLLSDYRRHAGDTVPPDMWVDFSDIDDCVEKIRYYLAHFTITRQLAERLHHEVVAHHTYAHRARAFIDLAQAWRQGAPLPAVVNNYWRRTYRESPDTANVGGQ